MKTKLNELSPQRSDGNLCLLMLQGVYFGHEIIKKVIKLHESNKFETSFNNISTKICKVIK